MTEEELGKQADAFLGAVRRRIFDGHREYGDRSFSRDPVELLGEVREELADIVGWSFILDARLGQVERALRESEG